MSRRLLPKKDLSGMRFGKLTVTSFDHIDEYSIPHYNTICDCGTSKVIAGSSMTLGYTKSCGCYRKEVATKRCKGKKLSIETKRKISENHADISGPNNPNYGKHMSEETKRKLSASKIGKMTGKNHPRFGKTPPIECGYGTKSWITKKDGSIVRMRSTYEDRVARELEKREIGWEYERRFRLDEDTTWAPDFYIIEYNLYIEVKGQLLQRAKDKMIKFLKKYPNIDIRVIQLNDIKELESGKDFRTIGLNLNEYLYGDKK